MASSYVSELRIVLLGKDSSEISRVGNFILRRKAFDSEAPPSSVKQHNETAGGMVEGRYINLINTPHLLDPQLSPEELNQRVRECVHLCSPGPHVFLLVLQSENFTEQDCETIRNALEYFSPFSLEYTIVLITKSKKQRLSYCENNEPEKNKNLQQLISTCRGGSEKIKFNKAQVLQLLKKITKMVEGSRGHLTCQFNEPQTVKCSAASGRGQTESVEKGKTGGDGVKKKKRVRKKNEGSPRLNLVVCGSNRELKSSILDLILGQRELRSESGSVCVKREAEVCGRLITLVELPALYSSQLSEEEVMRETLRCVSLCDPGVHAFLLVLPEGRLTDEDKGELEKIQNIFGSSFNNHTISVITTESQQQSGELDKATKQIPETFKRHCVCVLDSSMESVLMNEVDLMLKHNSGSCYTSSMYLTAQVETQLRYKTEIKEQEKTIKLLTIKKETQGTSADYGKTFQSEDTEENSVVGAEEYPDQYEAQLKIEQLLIKLNLTEKLKTADVLKIRKPCTENDMVQNFLQRLLLMNYRARCGESGQINKTQIPSVTENDDEGDFYTDLFKSLSEEAVQSSLVHPMDVQMAVFHCSDSFLKQLIVTKLSQCQYALPLLVPDPFTGEIEFPLWTFRQIRKSWKSTDNSMKKISKEQSIATLETPMVSFFRLGATSTSKSQLMNRLINEKHDTFFHRDCPGSSRNRLLMDGVVEVAWYCPSGKSTDHFTDCVAFCNLHGDAETHEKQLEILTEMSSVNVVVLGDQEKNKRSTKLQKLYNLSKPMICLLSKESSSVTQLKSGKYRIGIKNRNQTDVSAELRQTIGELISKTFTIEKLAEHSDIKVDEENGECKQGKYSAKTMTNFLYEKDISTIKDTHFPCHGRLWKNWCQKNKELHRPQDSNIELMRSRLRVEMEEIREHQKAWGLTEFMESFIEKLNTQTAEEMRYFLKWITIFLDNHNSDLSSLQKDYDDKWTKILNLKKKHDKSGQLEKEQTELEKISENLNAATFGLEHIFREIGQIYESHMSVKKNKKQAEEKLNRLCLPKLAADLIISGYPLELMDGDAAHVPLVWVSAVLDELSRKLGEQRVFVLSVLGIQSSGKSTMLNTMFGLQFAVSAGRCTKGAFMQLVKVSEEMKGELKFDYILVVDTEGLRAPELAGMSIRHHDNELATFVVGLGNLTLINIFGENPSEMQDILQIVVQAFMRMKKVRLNPSCVFVHQNVTDVAAGDKNMEGRRRLQEKLDEMTKLAAKEEVCDAECFSDVIAFDVQKDVRYFAQLWEGSPPMAPPNPSYSECVQELKNTILKKASTSHTLTLSEFSTRLKDLWSALLHESFVFSFKNTLEIVTYRKLESEFSKWTWNLRSAMLCTEDKLLNRIANGDLHVGEKDLVENMKKTREEVTKSMMQFFEENKDKDTLIQWKSRFTSKIGELYDELVKETKRKLGEVIEQKKTKETLEKRKTEYEKKLFNLSKELAQRQNKEKADEQTLKTEFDNVWRKWISDLTKDIPKIKDIDFWEDVTRILSESFEISLLHDRLSQKAYKNINHLGNFSGYIVLNKNDDLSNNSEQPQTQKKRGWTFNPVPFLRNMFPKEKNVNAEEHISIRDLINDTVEETSKLIKAIWRAQAGYNTGQVQQIIDLVKNTVKEYQIKKQSYVFRKEFTVDLCLFVCDLTKPTFVKCYEQVKRANNPKHYLENQKEQYYKVCQGATTTAIFGELLCSKLEPSILQAVYNQTAINVAADMRDSIPAFRSNRSNLERNILKTLAEEENFEDYREYIHSPKQYFTRFIMNQAVKYLNNEKNKILIIFRENLENKKLKINNAVFVATDEVKRKHRNANMWMGCFSKTLIEDLKFTEISNVDSMEITDLDFLCKIVTEGLTKMVKKLHEADIKLEMLQNRSEKILIDNFCQCCWAQCPFCNAICIGTMKDHDGEHSVPFHRADGISGMYYRGTVDLRSDFCTTVVQSDKRFFPSDDSEKSVPYKQYRTAGGEYATWNITPDCSELPYWKWFVCRFQKDLENLYSKKFQGSGEIPDEWKKYTKEDALESLNNYI